jgi:CubicO group peptidase (beta-lactamase class C family)
MPIDERLLEDAAAYIGDWVEYRQRTLAVPGIAVAVGFRGRLLLSRAYGMADLERGVPLTTEHVFRIASHSKTFTATAVMQLVEQGRLALDERAGERLDWLPSGPGELGRVTVRQLLSHAAGVIRDGEVGGFWQLERDFPDAAEMRQALAATPPVYPGSHRFKYSNFGYSLLGMLVEAASGEPYNEYVRRHVVDRLGLASTGPELDDFARERLATGYTSDHYGLPRLPVDHLDTHAMSPATGFYSTAEDLCRYGAAHCLGNEELLTDESKREMQHEAWKVEGVPISYGLGFDVTRVGERRLVGHGGGFPGFITSTKIDPVDRLVLVALTNAWDGPAAELTTGMAAIVNRALAAQPAASEAEAEALGRFTGRFWALRGATDVVRFGGQLLALAPELPAPVEQATELTVADGGGDVLEIAKEQGFASPGERVRYTFGEGGRVERVQWAAATCYPWETFEATVLGSIRSSRRGPQRDRQPAV